MRPAVMASIRPKWCAKIEGGRKTVEVRTTRPKIDPPFRCYMYCSKGSNKLLDIIRDGDCNYGEIYHGPPVFITSPEDSFYYGNHGKVVGDFICDKIITIQPGKIRELMQSGTLDGCYTGMTTREFVKYAGEKTVYFWHISDLNMDYMPRELTEFRRVCRNDLYCESCAMFSANKSRCGNAALYLTRPPQSWCYVEEMK